MRGYELSNSRARVIDQLVADGVFPNPQAALNDAVDSYLRDLLPQPQAGPAIDIHPADNGAYRTQEQWITSFNEQGRPMISAADVYRAAKYASGRVLKSLRKNRKDLAESLLVTGTETSYGEGLSGIITQNYGSKVVEPFQTYVPVIPVYNGVTLAKAFQTEIGVIYVQAVLDTNDDPETIAQNLERLSWIKADKTYLSTPDRDSRKKYPERAVVFGFGGSKFLVLGNYRSNHGPGRSHAVLIRQRRTRKKQAII